MIYGNGICACWPTGFPLGLRFRTLLERSEALTCHSRCSKGTYRSVVLSAETGTPVKTKTTNNSGIPA